jgi:xylulokinase
MDVYDIISSMAARSPVGAGGLLFNPTLAMGSPLDQSVNTKGAFTGLDLKHGMNDLLRATLEGITLNLGMALNELKKMSSFSHEMLLVGGGSGSPIWRQIFADIYEMKIIRTNVGQNAGALGAAAVAAVGAGLWPSFERVEKLHEIEDTSIPILENVNKYREIMKVFQFVAGCQAEIGDRLAALTSARDG